MGGEKLKRRNSLGFPVSVVRRESIGHHVQSESLVVPDVMEPMTQEVWEEEEAAERRARNQQRKQLETGVQDSEGLERQTGSQGGIHTLSHGQLAEHYQHCLKLSAENKVSTKNAFNLQLIDWMAQAMSSGKRKKFGSGGGVDMDDFQIAAGTLDASTKIYGFRVDVVYNDTFKLASGLTQSGKQQVEDNQDGSKTEPGDENSMGEETKKRKKIKKSCTIEKNIKNINISKIELEFDVDPLFKKTTGQMDAAGGGGNQFLASLRMKDDSGELMMDSGIILETRDCFTPRKSSETTRIASHLDNISEIYLCPEQLRYFNFTNWTLDGEDRLHESMTASQEERDEQERKLITDNAFDASAVAEYDDGAVDNDINDNYDEVRDESERVDCLATVASTLKGFTDNLQMTSTDMFSILTLAPLEYSYFDHGKLGAWAGPKHWKFKPLSKQKEDGGSGNTGGRKKQIFVIDYNGFEDCVIAEVNKIVGLLQIPKKTVKLTERTMKSWSKEKATLPVDLRYSGHQLVRLKNVEKIVVTPRTSLENAEVEIDENVEDYDYNNSIDNDGYCPNIDGQEDAYGDGEVAPGIVDEENGSDGLNIRGLDGQLETYVGDNLVEAPKIVDRAALQIGYAKTAKKVDMKRIKETTWGILTDIGSQDDHGTSTKSLEQEMDGTNSIALQETTFSNLYETLKQPNILPKQMSDNLSVPLAFIALLHLCNEKTLKLDTIGEDLKDFTVSLG